MFVGDKLLGRQRVLFFNLMLVTSLVLAVRAKWLVWLFDRLMGNNIHNGSGIGCGSGGINCDGNDSDNDKQMTATTLVNWARALFLNDGNIAFKSQASLGVQMDFPKWMRSMIPYVKQMLERSGNKALRKVGT